MVAYAIAVPSPAAGGRYLILQRDAPAVELATYVGRPSLSCYTVAEAKKLNVTISQSETIEGSVAPRWSTGVVCGFVDATISVCWQYSPVDLRFVKVGGWTT